MNKQVEVTCPSCGYVRFVMLSGHNQKYNRKCRKCCYKTRKHRGRRIGEKHLMKNGYVRVCTAAGWVYEHRHVWEVARGPIPAGYTIHHKDRDRTNNDISNLEMLPKGVHNSIDSTEMWEKVRAGVSESRNIPNKKNIDIDTVVFLIDQGSSIRAVAKGFGATKGVIQRVLRENGYKTSFNRNTHTTIVYR